ncbi:MAG: hypothetical protein QOE08_1038 [Thermoleophilaceae bacterium]|jgi:hypothetical protein|nr:hypothetical protein [Thermoleophilaceae bacterium]
MTQREESDQLPEEGPGGQATDDDSAGDRDDANENAGGADDDGDEGEGGATGNPANAG